MVTVDNSGCTCNCTSTAGAYDNSYSGTAASTCSSMCNNCYRYGRVYITETNIADEEIPEPEIMPVQWKIIRTIFYVILILKHYVESVARAPPFLLDIIPPYDMINHR